jgi:ABC-type phosphate/phosphonate transport system, ATPase component
MLKFDKVTKTFGANTAVNAASFTVDKPMMIGIIGRSGAGKSTLLRILNRLSDATSGQITFDGLDVTALRGAAKRSWQSQCAMIFQQFNLVPRMDVVSNVLHGTLNRQSTLATMFNLYQPPIFTRRSTSLTVLAWPPTPPNGPRLCPVASNSVWRLRAR